MCVNFSRDYTVYLANILSPFGNFYSSLIPLAYVLAPHRVHTLVILCSNLFCRHLIFRLKHMDATRLHISLFWCLVFPKTGNFWAVKMFCYEFEYLLQKLHNWTFRTKSQWSYVDSTSCLCPQREIMHIQGVRKNEKSAQSALLTGPHVTLSSCPNHMIKQTTATHECLKQNFRKISILFGDGSIFWCRVYVLPTASRW